MELVVQLLSLVEVIIFAWGIVQLKFCKNKIRLLIGGTVFLGCSIIGAYYDIDNILLLMAVLLLPVLGFVLLFDEKMIKKIIKYFFCDAYVGFIYLPIGLVITGICSVMNVELDENLYRIVRRIVSIAVILWLSYLLDKKRDIKAWIKEIPIGYFVIAWVCGMTIDGINSYSNSIMKGVNGNVKVLFEFLRTILSVAIYTLGIGFSFADFLRKKYRDESILKDEYLRMSKEHYSSLVTHMKEVRSIRHDMRAHIHMIRTYIKNKDFSAMEAYVDELASEHSLQTVKYYNTGNELVDAILTDGMRRYNDDGVRLECKGSLEDSVKISDYDLCIIMSNLLSNAIEACEKLVNSEKLIKVLMESNERTVRIVFENPVEWEVDLDKLGAYTSKADKDNHGLGINNVKRTVEKYDGTMVMSREEDKFRTIIVINI